MNSEDSISAILSQENNCFDRARASIQQAISWYGNIRRHGKYTPDEGLQTAVRSDLQNLKNALDKLDQKLLRISTFGLVSCGKSSVINALVGREILKTGPLNGVTQFPQSTSWQPTPDSVEVELIDTPGLDEIDGQAREKMAQEIAQKSDLILFVIAGDITRTEYLVLCQLRRSQKPLIIIFNKVDLYPDKDRQSIYQQLQLLNEGESGTDLGELISTDEIVMVAAKPQAIQVRSKAEDGTITEFLEEPRPQIDELQNTILRIVEREGRSLLALNSLVQARNAEKNIANQTVAMRKESAQEIIWKYARYKALAVALNPFPLFDVLGGLITDLFLIRSLGKLYGLPITTYEAQTLFRKIFASSGGLLLGEIGSNIILGAGKGGGAILGAVESAGSFAIYTSTATAQAAIAGYGTYVVGQVTQSYLEKGCTWGSLGASTVIAEILSQAQPKTIIYRLKQELL
ncbi:small GTP-binding protein domain protein [Xenococcus sp. PCC 7305]|uniref:GTP-binding protein n=1 Tax=Xenococcus sp. PCC 7305 TaxID=102125 RepID=UPI0002AD069E|nr:GTP-binding protein [Xenococcus sp. PCC 7305]ELS05049.1 small GTP-binding protein domain protein [Xenococcus sp. PCC 7305]